MGQLFHCSHQTGVGDQGGCGGRVDTFGEGGGRGGEGRGGEGMEIHVVI